MGVLGSSGSSKALALGYVGRYSRYGEVLVVWEVPHGGTLGGKVVLRWFSGCGGGTWCTGR